MKVLPPPIEADKHSLFADNPEEMRYAQYSDPARVLFIVLYRLDLIQRDTASQYVITRWRLRNFGKRWYERWRSWPESNSLYKES